MIIFVDVSMMKFVQQVLIFITIYSKAHAYYLDYPYYTGKICDSSEESKISECSSPSVNEYTEYECISKKTRTGHTQEVWVIVKQEKCTGGKSTCECFHADTTTCECVDPNVVCKYGDYQRMECLASGKGFIDYRCKTSETSLRDNWVKEREVKCRGSYSKCECYEDDEMEGNPQMCHCVDSRVMPKLPTTGVIRWNGSYIYDYDGDVNTMFLPGEIHKDSGGRYLRKMSDLQSRVNFEIVLPNVGGFIKYSGQVGNRRCNKKEVEKGGKNKWDKILQSPSKREYRLTEEVKKEGNVTTQIWSADFSGYEGYEVEKWKVVVDYNEDRGIGIPVKQTYNYVDHWEWVTKRYELRYTYETLAEGESSFNLQDYCDDV